MTDDALDVLLLECDSAGARRVAELLESGTRLDRVDLDGADPDRTALHRESTLEAGLRRLSDGDVDVVLLDLGRPDSDGFDALVRVLDAADFTPVVALTDRDDRDLGIQAIREGARDYLVKDDLTGDLLIGSIRYAVEQSRQERERVRHREQLEALNRLYGICQDVVHALITESTREGLERAVCERLVEPDAYDFAWIGEVNRATDRLSAREFAPADAEFDATSEPSAGDAGGERPEIRAVRTRSVQIVQDGETAPEFERCHRALRASGYRAAAAIPVAYGNVCYGVVAVYDESPDAFVGTDRERLSRLGEIVGHAIAGVERRDALTSDTVFQLTFSRDRETDALVAASSNGWRLDVARLVGGDPGILAYGTVEGIVEEELSEIADRSVLVEGIRKLSPEADGYEIELTTTWGERLVPALAKHGALVTGLTIADGQFRFVVEVPSERDKHQIVDIVRAHYPDATLRAQWTVARDDPAITDFHLAFENQLTEKQRAVLETAYHAGYFDWPRKSTGEEVAALLGVTQATFS
ncbi:MAG: bacterio-opsin activator domain-containing protein, partial [Haloferacaceae archaeon]